ncbi:MAG TPA: amino acid adenylation domain-containing protein [Actinophytocola sp.]|nr:amino acid adenylation domain-containing protein [Actinophytocola sp.]HEU5472606.1 amino acid adenylation domain-containing protein [Actinophytocola sp.]
MVEFSGTRELSLCDLFRAQVLAEPEHTAVVCGVERLSYAELARHASGLAAHLHGLGVAVDDRVGVFVEPSIDLMVATWGILLAGGAYLPLSPEYPEDRLRYMIEDSRTKVIVAQDALADRLAELAPAGTTIVALSDAGPAAAAPAIDLRPEHLAYVIYTSGSTGKPKGVMIEHRGIVNQMRWLADAYQLDRNRIVLQKTPMSFDAAQWEILAPTCGATVVMGSPGAYRDPERLVDIIATHGVTTLQCVPTLLQALLDTEEFGECKSLTQVFCGGEALTKTLALQFFDVLPDCELINLYGPTECTINSSAHTVDPGALLEGPKTISIGAPVHDTRYYILDGQRAPVGVGEIGELYIGGVQLARGYLHRPDLTADRFIDNPFAAEDGLARLYRTGDLASRNPDGTVQFAGRSDNQIKLRGFRIELDEIRLAIETHDWVKNAAVIVRTDPRTRFQNLLAFIELNPKEAALMDQGNAGAHHQSKASRLQLKAQLSNNGCRDAEELHGKEILDLPGRTPTATTTRDVFARKTYRFFEGGPVSRADILALLDTRGSGAAPRALDTVDLATLGEMLRWFGQFHSAERLLPKYGYASPGSLYATQLYLELAGIAGLAPGYYYYHPVHHQLVLIRAQAPSATTRARVHLVGKKRAIEPVYQNNIREVLEIETGHLVGMFEQVLPGYGLDIRPSGFAPSEMDNLECAAEDYYLGAFELVPFAGPKPAGAVDVYVQAHPGKVAGLPGGQYRYTGGELVRISDELVQRKHVIAINQGVYDRASFGISLVSREPADWLRYVELGRTLHHLQANDLNLGLMSSGYSSKSGNDLPSARRLAGILADRGEPNGPSYFFVGGRISDEQRSSTGMKEDTVHMRGPTEMIRDDLVNFLPNYMMPNRVVVLDRLPQTVNGKIDLKALEASEQANLNLAERTFVAPRTATERRIAALWGRTLKQDEVSVLDDFFECGGNSLTAVALINKTNREFGTALPLQVLFAAPTVERLAREVDGGAAPSSRFIPLRSKGSNAPVFCWPGLGGYPMNLRTLAERIDIDRPFYGVQAYGINAGEVPYATIREMAARDIEEIKRIQPEGPYTLWGYSFGARVAFETAHQLEQAGDVVANLFLIAPGSPKVRADTRAGGALTYANRAFVTILFSVFAGTISGPDLDECLRVTADEDTFVEFMTARLEHLDAELVRRIVRIVHRTYHFKYTFHELTDRTVNAPITIFKAHGDDYSFIEESNGFSAAAPVVVTLAADHYGLLRDPDVAELVTRIRHRLRTSKEGHRAAREHQVFPDGAQRRAAVGTVRRDNHRRGERIRMRRGTDLDRTRTGGRGGVERAGLHPGNRESQPSAV